MKTDTLRAGATARARAAALLAASLTLSALNAAEQPITLPSFSVSADRTDAYRATDSMSAARIRGALIDTPATVNVITSDFLRDISAASLFDATQYVSGIGNGRLAGGSGILDRQTIRGYENDGRTIDNFSSGFQANLDPLLYERVEIVKGPNAILAPTGTPGGAINVITKSPQFTRQNTASLEIGRFFANKLSVDSTGPVPGQPKLAYRVVAGYQDADSFVPGSIRVWTVNPQLTYRFSERAQLTLKLNHVQWGTFGAASNPSITLHAGPEIANGAELPDTPPAGFRYGEANGSSADWAARTDRVQRGTLEFTTALADRVSMRLAALRHYDHFWTDFTGLATPGQSTQATRYNPTTGVYTPELVWTRDAATGQYVSTFSRQYDPASIPRTAGYQHTWTHDTQLQNDYAGNFALGPVSLQPVAGGSYQRMTSLDRQFNAAAGQLAPLNLFAPDNNPPHPTAYTVGTHRHTKTTKKQLYAFARIGFFQDRLLASGGISRLWLNVPVENRVNNTRTLLKGGTNTPSGGLLFKPRREVAVYYNYSTNANGVLFNNQALFQEGKQHEVGVKTELLNQRLSINVAGFDISQNNIVTPNPSFFIDPANNPQSFRADLTNEGIEVDVVGGITRDLSVVASYTKMELRDAFGRRLRNIPDTTLNALVKYQFREGALKNASVFAAVTHVGDQAGENPAVTATPLGAVAQVSFYARSRTIYNAGASYTWGKFTFNLNVDNVLDEQVIWQPSGRFSLSPYPEINYRLTTTVRF